MDTAVRRHINSLFSKIGSLPQRHRGRMVRRAHHDRVKPFALSLSKGEKPPTKKASLVLIHAFFASPRPSNGACIYSRRVGVYDPIAVSRLRGRSHFVAAKARLDHKERPPQRSPRLRGEPGFLGRINSFFSPGWLSQCTLRRLRRRHRCHALRERGGWLSLNRASRSGYRTISEKTPQHKSRSGP